MCHQYLTPYLAWPLSTTIYKIYSSCSHCIARVPYGHACFSSNNFYINSWWAVFIVTWHIFSKTVRKRWCNTSICNAFHVRVVRKLICIIQKLQAHSVFWLLWGEHFFFNWLRSKKIIFPTFHWYNLWNKTWCRWMLNHTEDSQIIKSCGSSLIFIWLKIGVQLA